MAASVDESYRFLAAGYVGKQAKQLAKQFQGVRRAEDIECVHQARVASRRLRASFRMFRGCFGAKRLKKWRSEIRRVTAGLGAARDTDVQIEFLCGTLGALKEKDSTLGIARLLAQLQKRREALQPETVEAVDRLQASGVLDDMQTAAKTAASRAEAQQLPLQSPLAYRRTAKHILRRLDKLFRYQDSLADPEDQRRHHAMRIAAKRLRYTLEIAKPVYGGELDGSIDAVKKVQTLLGDVHDCDVWRERLEAFAKQERRRIVKRFGHAGPFARLSLGIEYLQQERRANRRRVFQELVQYWQDLSRKGHWENLAHIVRRHGELSGAVRHHEGPAGAKQSPEATQGTGAKRASRQRKLNSRPPVVTTAQREALRR